MSIKLIRIEGAPLSECCVCSEWGSSWLVRVEGFADGYVDACREHAELAIGDALLDRAAGIGLRPLPANKLPDGLLFKPDPGPSPKGT